MVDGQLIQSAEHVGTGFHLHAPKVLSTVHDEVVAMQVPICQIYFIQRIMDLPGIRRVRGLDKIPDKIDSCTILGASGTMSRD
jgi:hypothetical protein